MDDKSFKLLGKYLPSTYAQQAQDSQNTRTFLTNQLLEKVGQSTKFQAVVFEVIKTSFFLCPEQVA